jgi:hypothetical protein
MSLSIGVAFSECRFKTVVTMDSDYNAVIAFYRRMP